MQHNVRLPLSQRVDCAIGWVWNRVLVELILLPRSKPHISYFDGAVISVAHSVSHFVGCLRIFFFNLWSLFFCDIFVVHSGQISSSIILEEWLMTTAKGGISSLAVLIFLFYLSLPKMNFVPRVDSGKGTQAASSVNSQNSDS